MYYRKMARDLCKLIWMVYSTIFPFFNVSKICTSQQKNYRSTCSWNHQQIMYIFFCNHNYMYFLFHTLFCHLSFIRSILRSGFIMRHIKQAIVEGKAPNLQPSRIFFCYIFFFHSLFNFLCYYLSILFLSFFHWFLKHITIRFAYQHQCWI